MSKVIDLRGKTMGGGDKRSKITKIARHHSASETGDVFIFQRHWKGARGWNTGGYHEVILRNGDVQLCYDHSVVTNGVKGHNQTAYHICMVGNGSFTDAQEQAFDTRAKAAMKRFNLVANDVLGHNEFSGQATACPGIDMDKVRNRLKGGQVSTSKKTSSKPKKPAPKPKQTLLRKGDKGQAVKSMQQKLIAKGYKLPRYGADGDFGDETLQAVTAFQRDHSLTVDGIAGKQTMAELDKPGKKPSSSVIYPNRLFKIGSRGGDVRRIQRAINNAVGRNILVVDGIYGAKTEKAVRDYQRRHRLAVDGIVGLQTWTTMF